MTQNVLDLWPEIIWVVGGIAVLLAFSLAVALPQKSQAAPGRNGHRPEQDETLHEEAQPDGFIDSFASDIEEAGGGIPPIVKAAIPIVLLSWLLYMIVNWAPASGG